MIRATFGVTSTSSLTLSTLCPNVCKVVDIIVLFQKRTFPKKTQQQFRNRKQKCTGIKQLRTAEKMKFLLCVFQSLSSLKFQYKIPTGIYFVSWCFPLFWHDTGWQLILCHNSSYSDHHYYHRHKAEEVCFLSFD